MPLEIALVMIISTPLSDYRFVLADWRPEHDRESRQVLANLEPVARRGSEDGIQRSVVRSPRKQTRIEDQDRGLSTKARTAAGGLLKAGCAVLMARH